MERYNSEMDMLKSICNSLEIIASSVEPKETIQNHYYKDAKDLLKQLNEEINDFCSKTIDAYNYRSNVVSLYNGYQLIEYLQDGIQNIIKDHLYLINKNKEEEIDDISSSN